MVAQSNDEELMRWKRAGRGESRSEEMFSVTGRPRYAHINEIPTLRYGLWDTVRQAEGSVGSDTPWSLQDMLGADKELVDPGIAQCFSRNLDLILSSTEEPMEIR